MIPWLYLKGVAAGETRSALEVLVGAEAKRLSANVVGRLKRQWLEEYESRQLENHNEISKLTLEDYH